VCDLLPICARLSIPLVYDVHHHRCNPDGLTIEEATQLAAETWQMTGREQYCHLSSPRAGWAAGDPKPHADYIDLADVPTCWLGRTMTVDIEAKAKELAVVKLMTELKSGGRLGYSDVGKNRSRMEEIRSEFYPVEVKP
jgi:UV DNA damage endonuclease